MRVPGLKFMRSVVRWSSLVHQRHVLVLGYHRIAEPSWDPYNICVTPEHFDEQLEVLRSLPIPFPWNGWCHRSGVKRRPCAGSF
jgi:hypothetical protein